MKLLLLGLIIPAGNMQRQVIEGMALTLLVSRRSLGARQKYIQGKLSSHKALKALRKYATTLGIDPMALSQLESKGRFYDKFSHPTYMTVAHSMFVKPSQGLGLGGFFDEGKLVIYEKEVRSRVNCAAIFENFIDAVKINLDID